MIKTTPKNAQPYAKNHALIKPLVCTKADGSPAKLLVVAGCPAIDGVPVNHQGHKVALFHKGDSTPELMKLQGFNCTAVRHD